MRRTHLLLFSFLFGIIILIFLRDFIFLGGTWNEGDYGVQHYPWAKFYAEQLKQFRLPLWCDFNHCGFPLFAEGQVGAIYPINLLLFFALPFEWAYNGGIVLHFFLAGFCMFVFLRFLKCSFVSGFIGALVWVFGSAFAGAEYNLMALRVLTWFPLALFLIERHLKKRKTLFLLLLALLYFFQWTAGSIQFACYAIFFSSLYFLILLIKQYLHERSFASLFKSLFLYLLSIGFSFGLSAAQILPTLELTRETLRAQHANLEFSLSGSFSPLALFSMIFPRATSSISGWKIYVGLFPVFLFCLLFLGRKGTKCHAEPAKCHPEGAARRISDGDSSHFMLRMTLGFAFLTLFFAFGKFNPLYQEMVKFFHLYFFRSPGKFTIFTSFFLSVLTAFGFELFLRILEEDSTIIRSVRKIFGGL
ncbi:MAG: YfhO family protein, partial [Deltaproteobacteria bacterium]